MRGGVCRSGPKVVIRRLASRLSPRGREKLIAQLGVGAREAGRGRGSRNALPPLQRGKVPYPNPDDDLRGEGLIGGRVAVGDAGEADGPERLGIEHAGQHRVGQDVEESCSHRAGRHHRATTHQDAKVTRVWHGAGPGR